MSQGSREYLVEGFIGEIKGYIPLIRDDLAALKQDGTDGQDLEQVHRLFHNIKGASSQLSLVYLSDTARIVEDLLDVLLEDNKGLESTTIEFIDRTAEAIYETCLDNIKDQEAGRELLLKTITGFRGLAGISVNEHDESVKIDMVRLKNGQSLMAESGGEETSPLDYLRRGFALIPDIQEIVQNEAHSDRVSLLFEELLQLISAITHHDDLSDNQNITRCTESLGCLVEWFKEREPLPELYIFDLFKDYLLFIELLIENPELSDPGKVDHVIETMDHLRVISSTVAADSRDDTFAVEDKDFLIIDDDSEQTSLNDDLLLEEDGVDTDEDDVDLHDIFLAECEEHLQVIGQSLSALEQQVTVSCKVTEEVERNLSDMRRAVHTLKGAAGMTGFMELSDFANQNEDFLDDVLESGGEINPEEVSALSDAAEMMESMSLRPEDIDGSRIAETGGEINRLLEVRKGQQELTGSEENEQSEVFSDLLDIPEFIEDEKELLVDDENISELELQYSDEVDEEIEGLDSVGSSVDLSLEEDYLDEEDTDLHEIFLVECEEHLQVIGRSLVALEQQVIQPCKVTGAVEQNLSETRRAVHTLKGAAGMTGFMQLSSFAHRSEDLLDVIFESGGEVTPDDISVLVDAADLIEVMSLRPDSVDERRLDEINGAIAGLLAIRSATEEQPTLPDAETFDRLEIDSTVEFQDELDNADSPAGDPADSAILPGDTASVRVRLESLDELVSIESELIVGRSSMEQGLDELLQTITELNTAKERLRRISHELETGFEVDSLYGFGTEASNNDESRRGETREAEFADFDPIELDRYSQLSLIIRSLNEISVDVGSIHAEMSDVSSELRGHMARQQLMMGVMQDKLMRVRMTPMSSISRSFFRTVRGAADRLGKQVRLLIDGEDVYLDRYIWTRIADPIMHILRNAVDHGVENEQERRENGKPPFATIQLQASQKGSHVVLNISDDGRGIDHDAIREKLVREGLVEDVAPLSDDDLLEYLFVPGFSTRGKVSQLSGRGVGLDVVRQNIKELRGSVRVRPQDGGGTSFELRIPVTLALNRAIIVRLGSERFAIPLHDVLEIRKVAVSDITDGERLTISIGNKELRFNDLSALIGLRQGGMDELFARENIIVFVVPGERENEVLAVDAIIEQQEIIVKDLGSHLKHVFGISGVTIMGDGVLVPILNTSELSMSERKVRFDKQLESPDDRHNKPLKVMVVDDSVSVRQSVSRLIKSKGWKSSLATDGVDAVEKIDQVMPDIIILDIEMPRMNGFEFMNVLRSSKQFKEIPVIMLTSRISDKHREKAKELGVNHYLSKPYQEDEFIGLIREATGK